MHSKENVPTYFRIYLKLKHSILTGEYERGEKFGVIVDLAKKYAVSTSTISRALNILEDEGLLAKKQGMGIIIPKDANLDSVVIGKIIIEKKITAAVLESLEFAIISSGWVIPPRRVAKFYDIEPQHPNSKVFKIFHTMTFKHNPSYKVASSHYLSEDIFRTLKIDSNSKPFDMILGVTKWLDSIPLEYTESLRPYVCTNEIAELLGLPDGTPVFYHDYFLKDCQNKRYCWESISTGNLHTHKVAFTNAEVS
ncbi:MAG: GntR family transcriptional regulator [Desulfobacterales bacterium]|jgi:DNA-binding GntR family transcriptional regulator|nr:GntR family transcriptional regulator [Desulfobacterales bacterium]